MLTKEASYHTRRVKLTSLNRLLYTVTIIVWVISRAQAQQPSKPNSTPPSNSTKVYTYVEQMPALPGKGGMAALVAEIQRRIKVPVINGQPDWEKNMVYFVVDAAGRVREVKIIKSSRVPAYDQALLAAVRGLPRFNPGRQGGKPVVVSFRVPVNIHLQ